MKSLTICLIVVLGLLSCRQQVEPETATAEQTAEKFRPSYHFTPDSMWMNDPNGLVFHNGLYHLFYQYYPDATVWGPMHWGHAVSSDMLHWDHQPIALYPDSLGYIFSGSAVFDAENSSGLGTDGKGPLIAIFTHHQADLEKSGSQVFQYQSIAYSNDEGKTWTKYANNPVIANPGIRDFRDPKVFYYEAEKNWRLILAAQNKVLLYRSEDLLHWTQDGSFGDTWGNHGGVWECPDLFPLTTEAGITKWVMLVSINPGGPQGGSATQYFVGEYDGKTFVPSQTERYENENALWIDSGTDNYAGVTWSGVPKSAGRRLFIGWMSNWNYATTVPTERWRSANTLARELSLYEDQGTYFVSSFPVAETKAIEKVVTNLGPMEISADTTLYELPTAAMKIHLRFQKPASGLIAVRVSNSEGEYLDVGYNAEEDRYFVDRSFAGSHDFNKEFADYFDAACVYNHDEVELDIYLDEASVELFADRGKLVMTHIFFPSKPLRKVSLLSPTNSYQLLDGKISEMRLY